MYSVSFLLLLCEFENVGFINIVPALASHIMLCLLVAKIYKDTAIYSVHYCILSTPTIVAKIAIDQASSQPS